MLIDFFFFRAENIRCICFNREDEVLIMMEKFRRFMMGRYGVDSFSKFLLVAGVVLACISSFTKLQILYFIGWAALLYSYFRVFSKNYAKRAAENQKYLQITAKISSKIPGFKNRSSRNSQYTIFKCPGCKQKIRVPSGKGKIEIRCPKCGRTFIKRS